MDDVALTYDSQHRRCFPWE